MLLTRRVSILVASLELDLPGLWRFPNPDLFFLRTQWQLWLPRFRSPTTSDSRLLSSMIRPAIFYSPQALTSTLDLARKYSSRQRLAAPQLLLLQHCLSVLMPLSAGLLTARAILDT